MLSSIFGLPDFSLFFAHDSNRLTLTRAHDGVRILVVLPLGYPVCAARPSVTVAEAAGLSRARIAIVNATLAVRAATMHDGPCLMELCQAAMDAIDSDSVSADVDSLKPGGPTAAESAPRQWKRLWAHMHFIRGENDRRRREICSWAAGAGVFGICKPGFPRCMYLEGPADSVDACAARFKSEQWHNFDVRAEETVDMAPTAEAVMSAAAGGAGAGKPAHAAVAAGHGSQVLLLQPAAQEALKGWWADAVTASSVSGGVASLSPQARVVLLPEEPQDASMAVFAAAMAAMGKTSIFKSALLRS